MGACLCLCSPVANVYIGVFQLIVCLILTIVGYVSDYWADTGPVNFGLWEYCISDHCQPLPDDAGSSSSKIAAARIFGILGMLAVIGAMIAAVVFLVKRKSVFLLVAAVLSIVAFVMVVIEFSTAVAQVRDLGIRSYGFCFGLTIAAFVQAVFAAIAFLCAWHGVNQVQRQRHVQHGRHGF